MLRGHGSPTKIWDGDKVLDDPEEAASHIKKHWQKVFNKKKRSPTQTAKASAFLDEFVASQGKLDSMPDSYWKASPQDFEDVILASGNSAPGPDGISFECFKPISQVAALVFAEG